MRSRPTGSRTAAPLRESAFGYDPGWHLADCDPGHHYSWGTASGAVVTIFMGDAQVDPTSCPEEDESPDMVLSAERSDISIPPPLNPEQCGGVNVSQTSLTVDGVSGTRSAYTFSSFHSCIGTPIASEIIYSFSANNGNAYVFNYSYRQDGGTDLSRDFDVLVQDTLHFAAS